MTAWLLWNDRNSLIFQAKPGELYHIVNNALVVLTNYQANQVNN